jgi:hypothetical protein
VDIRHTFRVDRRRAATPAVGQRGHANRRAAAPRHQPRIALRHALGRFHSSCPERAPSQLTRRRDLADGHGPRRAHRRVDPSTSVKRNVTTPEGAAARTSVDPSRTAPALTSPTPRLHGQGHPTAHHRPPQHTPQHLGRLGRRPRPARRLARTGLTALTIFGGAVSQADPNDKE